MSSGYQAGGADLDTLFHAFIDTGAGSTTGHSVSTGDRNGDLQNRYQAIQTSSARGNVNFQAGGTDLAAIFMDINAVFTSLSSTNLGGGCSHPCTATTTSCTITPSGGSGFYNYQWNRTGGDASTSANSPNAATTTWSRTSASAVTATSTWTCTVTDTASRTVVTASVTVGITIG